MRFISARQMVFQAYQTREGGSMAQAAEMARLGARIQTTQLNNNDWAIVHGLEAGMVISVVESLPQHLQACARLFWGPFTRDELDDDRECVHHALVHAMQSRRLPGQGQDERPQVEAVRAMQELCWAAIYHHGEVTHPYGRRGLPGARSIDAWLQEERGFELDVRRWGAAGRLSWADVWRQMLNELDDWEAESLCVVSQLIDKAA